MQAVSLVVNFVKPERLSILYFFFFSWTRGELHIIMLRRKKGEEPLQTHTHTNRSFKITQAPIKKKKTARSWSKPNLNLASGQKGRKHLYPKPNSRNAAPHHRAVKLYSSLEATSKTQLLWCFQRVQAPSIPPKKFLPPIIKELHTIFCSSLNQNCLAKSWKYRTIADGWRFLPLDHNGDIFLGEAILS